MIDLSLEAIALLVLAAFAAGWIDAVSGGGGLIQLPALLLVFPESATVTAMGTNKTSSIIGTSAAVTTYARAHRPDWPLARRLMALAFVASGCGSYLATRLSTDFLRPVVFGVLLAVWVYTIVRKPVMDREVYEATHRVRAMALAVGIGFYDGLIGPGTGSFLLVALVQLVGLSFLRASATAKFVNWATNLASVIVFASQGAIWWQLGLAMGSANLVGGYFGSRTAIKRGSEFVRKLLLVAVALLIVRLAWSLKG